MLENIEDSKTGYQATSSFIEVGDFWNFPLPTLLLPEIGISGNNRVGRGKFQKTPMLKTPYEKVKVHQDLGLYPQEAASEVV